MFGEIEVIGDGFQRVIDLMGHGGRHSAYRGEPLAHVQGGFHALLLRNIAKDLGCANDLSALVSERGNR